MSRFPSRSWTPREPPNRLNGKIRAREVRVLDEEKKPLGVMSLNDAIKLAQQQGLDLVEIAATAVPPVCRIVDYGKFRYEQAKNEKHARENGRASRIAKSPSPKLGCNDFGAVEA